MGDLVFDAGNSNAPHSSAPAARPIVRAESPSSGFGRAVRSGAFLSVYACYVAVAIGLAQRLVILPAMALFPRRRPALVRWWLRAHARGTLWLARRLAGLRVSIVGDGAVAPESCIVVMNHQSVLDIPVGVWLIRGPAPLIPTRDRYMRGVPGISPLARLCGFPSVSQKRGLARGELQALTDAADQVARGERSFLIFPEGHRSRDGNIGRFMRSGLRIVLTRARRPVYCVVVDGIAHARTVAEGMTSFAGSHVRVTVLGPFDPPPPTPESTDDAADGAAVDAFIDQLHGRMTAALARLRGEGEGTLSPPPARAADPLPAR
jgi:1-acyl-sn-glycerol-3-phosphate acyltransferase